MWPNGNASFGRQKKKDKKKKPNRIKATNMISILYGIYISKLDPSSLYNKL